MLHPFLRRRQGLEQVTYHNCEAGAKAPPGASSSRVGRRSIATPARMHFGCPPAATEAPRSGSRPRRCPIGICCAAPSEQDDATPVAPQAFALESNEIVKDYRAMGFPLGRHPLALLRGRVGLDRTLSAEQLTTLRSGTRPARST